MTLPALPNLPIPALDQTLDQLLMTTAPLLSPEDQIIARHAATHFATHEGIRAQARLQALAETRYAENESWLSKEWLASYLGVREPLSLSTNVTFELDWPQCASPLDKAVDLIAQLTQLHLEYLNGKLAPLIGPRGEALSMTQWELLRGAIRDPQPEMDVLRLADNDTKNRHISLFFANQHILLPVTNTDGLPYSRDTLKQALQDIVASLSPAENAAGFTSLSHLGSAQAAPLLAELLDNPINKMVYEQLAKSWFTLSLFTNDLDADQQLEVLAFAPAQCWQYKPLSFQMNLSDGYLAVHVEHSGIDGATLKAMLETAHSLTTGKTTDTTVPVWQLANWHCPLELQATIAHQHAHFCKTAENYRLSCKQASIIALAQSKRKVSHDGLQQFALIYAQQAIFGEVRNTYEAVDMRNFLAGRTECLRPVSIEAVALIRALIQGDATPELLNYALAEHKRRVIACKTGQAMDRHLLGLRYQALEDRFFQSPAIAVLARDFLSTSSVGNQSPIRRFAFAPTCKGGFGVNYSLGEDHYDFCLSADSRYHDDFDEFSRQIIIGVEKLCQLCLA